MGVQVYTRHEFMIIQVAHEYVVVNRTKPFEKGHTHIKNFKTAKYVISQAIRYNIPSDLSPYLLTSLKRITSNEDYAEKLDIVIKNKKNKVQKYTNCANRR